MYNVSIMSYQKHDFFLIFLLTFVISSSIFLISKSLITDNNIVPEGSIQTKLTAQVGNKTQISTSGPLDVSDYFIIPDDPSVATANTLALRALV